MDERDLRLIVERVLTALKMEPSRQAETIRADLDSNPIEDITKTDIRRQYLVENPHDREAFFQLKQYTPARIGVGHAGARYRTATMLRFQADHAAAQSAVFTDVSEEFLLKTHLKAYRTVCGNRDEFLTRPDKGRIFSRETLKQIRQDVGITPRVLLYVADGLSSNAVEANAPDILPIIQKGLEGYGITCNAPFFVQYGRVATQDQLGDVVGAEVVCLLLGERPGLVTAKSLSAYIAYKPSVGMPESRRTVLANIHDGGTPCVEAGAHIVDLIRRMLEEKKSGVDLPI